MPLPLFVSDEPAPRPGRNVFIIRARPLPSRRVLLAVAADVEVLQVRLHVAEAEVFLPDPVVDYLGNLVESRSVSAVLAGLQAAGYKQEAVDHLV